MSVKVTAWLIVGADGAAVNDAEGRRLATTVTSLVAVSVSQKNGRTKRTYERVTRKVPVEGNPCASVNADGYPDPASTVWLPTRQLHEVQLPSQPPDALRRTGSPGRGVAGDAVMESAACAAVGAPSNRPRTTATAAPSPRRRVVNVSTFTPTS